MCSPGLGLHGHKTCSRSHCPKRLLMLGHPVSEQHRPVVSQNGWWLSFSVSIYLEGRGSARLCVPLQGSRTIEADKANFPEFNQQVASCRQGKQLRGRLSRRCSQDCSTDRRCCEREWARVRLSLGSLQLSCRMCPAFFSWLLEIVVVVSGRKSLL